MTSRDALVLVMQVGHEIVTRHLVRMLERAAAHDVEEHVRDVVRRGCLVGGGLRRVGTFETVANAGAIGFQRLLQGAPQLLVRGLQRVPQLQSRGVIQAGVSDGVPIERGTRGQVQLVFLVEAATLATLGGLLGIGVGLGLCELIRVAVPGLPVHTPPEFVVLAVSVSLAVGLLAGVTPARRAAHLDPIEALRTE